MKQYKLITTETLKNLFKCFASDEEMDQFIVSLDHISEEIGFVRGLRSRVSESDRDMTVMRQVCAFTLFCKDHIELIHELIRSMQYKEVSEDEMNNYTRENKLE